ncbi:MAG TPA: hypothetical protein VFQ76_20965 [Longimicrobiaceae bacterium]|nr:hypothetical protein [Longimicrobiaceae bacterium]
MPNTDVQYRCGGDDSDVTAVVRAARGEPDIPVAVADAEATTERRTEVSAPPKTVRVQCKPEQWCDFHGEAVPSNGVVKGVPVPKNEVTRFEEWQKYADPLEGMKRLDTYSTWLFTAHGLVILLATGLASQTDPGTLASPAAKWLFGAAVAAIGFSWVFNSFVKAPTWGELNRHSPPGYLRVFSAALQRRRNSFKWAASLLGVALALAALIPLARYAGARPDPAQPVITYAWNADSSYKAEFHGEGLRPKSPIDLLIQQEGTQGVILPVQRARADDKGKGTAAVSVPAAVQLRPPFRVVARWEEMDGNDVRSMSHSISFTSRGPQEAPPQSPPAPPAGDSTKDSAGNPAADSGKRSAGG